MFSTKNRVAKLAEMASEKYDVLVIGGGITGCGIALDAATRGMKVGVVEMQDFAAGTSSRSTKLVHGGLRYLKQFEVKMVAEVGKERAIVYENGPHVTTPEWMLLPFHTGGTFGKFSTSIGLMVYDFLAGVKRSERRVMFDANETLKREPLVKREGLNGGGYYVEYRTDDARLTMEVMKEAVKFGADAVNYTKVEKLLYDNKKLVGIEVRDLVNNRTYELYADKIVNAAGPWVDTIRELDGSKKGKTLQLTKGIHLVFDQSKFPLKQAIYFDTPDGRMVFAIPRDGKTYVGTTDTVFKEDKAHPRMTKADKEYVVKSINFMFPNVKVTEADIESSWTGIRPLIHEEGKDPSEISRKDEVWVADSGLITIAGGKLTGYRKMAEMVLDRVNRQWQQEGKPSFGPSKTKHLPISGGHVGGSANLAAFIEQKAKDGEKVGLSYGEAKALAHFYGSNVDEIFAIAQRSATEATEANLPLALYARLMYALQAEMTVTPVDFFVRRTAALFFNIALVHQHKEAVVAVMARELNWTAAQTEAYMEDLNVQLHDAVVAVDEK